MDEEDEEEEEEVMFSAVDWFSLKGCPDVGGVGIEGWCVYIYIHTL
jgi:hypothetical protein